MPAEFSADAEQRALEPWTIEIGGRVHTAAPVSRREVLAFWAVIERIQAGSAQPLEEEAALTALLRAAFPKRLSYWWFGDPVAQILSLDYRVRRRAIQSFFDSLAPVESPSVPGMNGTNGSRPSSGAGSGSPPAPASRLADGVFPRD